MDKKIIEMNSKKAVFPVTNHTKKIDENNVGWYKGYSKSGIPFEAELWTADEEVGISVFIPVQDFFEEDEPDEEVPQSNVICYEDGVETMNNGALAIGMVSYGMEDDLQTIQAYVWLLEKEEIIWFTTILENGAVEYVTDINGNDFARITVTLIDGDATLAFSDLPFEEFDSACLDQETTRHFSIVK